MAGAVRVRCLAQGQLETPLGEAGAWTSNLPVSSPPALRPEPHVIPQYERTTDETTDI